MIILACASVGGFMIPPLVNYQRKHLVEPLDQEENPGAIYGMNPYSGWMIINYFTNDLSTISLNTH